MDGIVPWDSDSKRLLDAAAAQQVGYPYLAAWLGEAEHLWDTHGAGRMSFSEQLDYFGKLSAQFPASATKSAPSVRVFCAASGTLPAAVVLSQRKAVLEHALYWAATGKREAQYLTAILNSEAGRSRAALCKPQPVGHASLRQAHVRVAHSPVQRQRRPTPGTRSGSRTRRSVAAKVPLKEGTYFVTARKHIRTALHDDGIGQEIEELVKRLLKNPE